MRQLGGKNNKNAAENKNIAEFLPPKFAYIKYFLYLCIEFEGQTQPKHNPETGRNLCILDFAKYWNA